MNTPSTALRRPPHRLAESLPIWLTGAMLGVGMLMIVGLLTFIAMRGLRVFLPEPIWQVTLTDGTRYLGLVHRRESIPGRSEPAQRTLYRIGNRELVTSDFVWIDDAAIASRTRPALAMFMERLEWGPFLGWLKEIRTPAGSMSSEAGDLAASLSRQMRQAHRRAKAIRRIERGVIGDINAEMETHRLALLRLEKRGQPDPAAVRQHRQAIDELQNRYAKVEEELHRRRDEDRQYRVVVQTLDGKTKELPISGIVRVHRPNQLSWLGRLGVYADRLREFVFDQPREANSEGGVAPAIFGTVLMTLIMSFAVVPLGVLAALYLHEYARQGALVSTVRIAVNNLAGVPSIVFGVFGLGFFCYVLGGTIDQLFFADRLPSPTFGGGGILWASLTLALLTVPVVIVATEEALAAVPNGLRAASLACGATKFQTICRVVLPAAVPGILTGTILAMARGAGEVAPLMITGVVKLAPELPLDHFPPFLHLERKFMHLGFHIYDIGFQSPNIEASKSMVYMTTLLLLGIVVCLNLTAMILRNRLRQQFGSSHV